MAGDAERISVRIGHIYDLVCEANAYAADSGRLLIASWDIERALAAKDDRAGRMKALEQDLIKRRLVFIETDGARVAQVNALTVIKTGSHDFGAPARITASVGPGLGQGVRIERLANYTGLSPRRGAQTLMGYLNATYAPFVPLSLMASVAFEQCYGPIDGDSASAAELIAILSGIADIPVAQGIGITGSIDQHGAMQPVGSINQKIEGFFDICMMRGAQARPWRHHPKGERRQSHAARRRGRSRPQSGLFGLRGGHSGRGHRNPHRPAAGRAWRPQFRARQLSPPCGGKPHRIRAPPRFAPDAT